MIARLLTGFALFGVGFFIGRELGKMDPLVEEMRTMLRDPEAQGRVIDGAQYSVNKPDAEPNEKDAPTDPGKVH